MPLWYDCGMTYYDYNHFKRDVLTLADQCRSYQPDTLLALARGGMTLGHALCMALNLRDLQSIRIESYDGQQQREKVQIIGSCDFKPHTKILIVDDIIDSGKTLQAVLPWLYSSFPLCEFKVATLYAKSSALIQPDYYINEADDWIDFFWERDFLTTHSI